VLFGRGQKLGNNESEKQKFLEHSTIPRGIKMIGKKNLVFGFFYLVLTASLGPYMIVKVLPAQGQAEADKQAVMGKLQQAVGNDFLNDNLETMSADQIAKSNSKAILSLSSRVNADLPIDQVRNAHAHGNLESILNILVGFLLCFVAISPRFKQVISWIFILGALSHSGLLLLSQGLQIGWANSLMSNWLVSGIGPVLILAGLLLAGIAALLGFRGEIVRDW